MTPDERGGGRNQFALWLWDCILLVEFSSITRAKIRSPWEAQWYAMYKHEYQQIKPNYTWNVIGSDVKKTVLVCQNIGASLEK